MFSTSSNSHLNPPSSPFQAIFDAALNEYHQKTGKIIGSDPLTVELQSCRSSSEVHEILQERAQKFDKFRNGGRAVQIMRKLKPTVDILLKLCNGGVLGEGVGLKFPPAKAIIAGIGILLSAAKDVGSSYDALMDLFDCLDNYLRRLEIFSEIPPAIEGVLVNIMVELLGVLALPTRQIKQGRFKKFAKKLLGENDIGAVLHRLDRLTTEESRMTVVQTMETSTQSMEVVRRLFSDMRTAMEDGRTSMDNIQEALVMLQEVVESVNKKNRDDLQQAVRKWLSPPDPSINHNAACESHHEGTGTWFTEGDLYKEWKAGGSFAWLHGKPGSGKSVLCSSIIKDLETMRKAGLASLAYYYFDFKDANKQDLRGLLSSLLLQLTARSNTFYDIVNRLYEAHDKGSHQPSESDLVKCLIQVLAFPGQGKLYLIMDALDECPDNSGTPTSREKVLRFVDEFLSLRLHHVRICITSRPEVDIQSFLGHLTSHCVSIHDQSGQRKDIIEYTKHFVESDQKMKKWREEDKELVINTLAQKSQGMFRWVYCQLDTLRRCFPGSIRRALDELPRTLDRTYERILEGIDEEKWEYALRLFRCLAVARRPLRAKELAEVLAIEIDGAGIPKLNVNLRPRDADDAILSACSTLVIIIDPNTSESYLPSISDSRDNWVVQFSHYSVKEYLASTRLLSSRQILSRFHISSEPAHTILVQSCISTLLQLGNSVNANNSGRLPLSKYAAQNCVDHAQVDGVASRVRIGLESLFDPELPHFTAWTHLRRSYWDFSQGPKRSLSYASLYGFDDVVKYLVATRCQDTNAADPDSVTPLLLAQDGGHLGIAQYLIRHGADVNYQGVGSWTPLLCALQHGQLDLVSLLLEHGANVNTWNAWHSTPLHKASECGYLDVVRQLIDLGADINPRDNRGETPLYKALRSGKNDVARLLFERGADRGALNSMLLDKASLLDKTSERGHLDSIQQLINLGADINARDIQGDTPLHKALRYKNHSVVQLLIERGADVHSHDIWGWTPLHKASELGYLDVVQKIIDLNADINAHTNRGATPLQEALRYKKYDAVQLLITRGADVNTRDAEDRTPLHVASKHGHLDAVKVLLNHGADLKARDRQGASPLHSASLYGRADVVQFLLDHGADMKAGDNKGATPLHMASQEGQYDVLQVLLGYGRDVNARDCRGHTPLHLASKYGYVDIVNLLLQNGADVNSQKSNGQTPLHLAVLRGHADTVRWLVEHRADVTAQDGRGRTPFSVALETGNRKIARLLSDWETTADIS